MNTQDTLPRWKLDTLFSSLESDEYTQALESYRTALTRAEQLLAECPNGQDDFSAWLSSYLTADDAVRAQSRTLSAYTYVVYSTDTTDPAALTALSRIEELGLRLHAITTSFRTILRAHRDQLDDFCAQHPEYERYRRMLSAEAELAAHQMESAQEALASDLQRTGGDAWGRLQEQITSTLSDDASGKTFNAIRNDAYSPDASLRRASYETELRLLKTHSVALAAALNNLKGETLTLNRRRRWDEPLSRALVANRMSRASLDALVTAIEESLPRWREYLRAKARILRRAGATASDTAGTAAEPGLAFYDLFAPLSAATTADSQPSSPVNRSWTFSEAREYIIERYNSFSPAMGRFAQQAFDNGWIDADVRSGKVGGAYDEDFPLGHQSRILVNFTGTFGDVVTLAHELGHAYHFSMLNGQPAHCFDYPMTLAETASTFAETIVKQDAAARSTGFDRLCIIESELQDVCQVLVDILCRFYFERSVFDARAHGELSAPEFCHLMRAAQEKSYGSGLNDERHEYLWAVKSHYYDTALDFYNFPYAFGQLFAIGLYEQFRAEGSSFVQTYEKLLSETGTLTSEAVCALAGFDSADPSFWKRSIAYYEEEIATITAYAASL